MNVKILIGLVLIGLTSFSNAAQRQGIEKIAGLGLTKNCFTGLYGEYDKWREKIISNKQKVDQIEAEKLFNEIFSKEKHSRLKNNINCYLFSTRINEFVVPAYYAAPKNVNIDKKLPVIIFNRGGNGRYRSLNFGELMQTIMPLAESGFIVLATKLRGSSKGRNNGLSHVGWDEFGGEDVNDVLELLNVIDGLPSADNKNIFMVGYSRGGMMTYLAADKSERFKAIATIGGISDLSLIALNRPKFANMLEKRINYTKQNKNAEFKKRSAIEWFGEGENKPPLLMIHGKLDDQVSVEQTTNLAAKLQRLNYPHSVSIYEDGDHDLMPYWDNVIIQVTNWFSKHRD
jgi:dipeptidyl aminopeptidase/acylaminoacyl peptidase